MDSAAQESNLKLIKEIEKRPCLYNRTLLNYSRKCVQEKAWDEVANSMGWPVSSCRERWRNLRCVYIRHMKKLSQGIRKRPYYLMKAMRFALPFVKTLPDLSSVPTELLHENKDEELEENYDEEEQQCDNQKSFEGSSPSPTQRHDVSSESPEPGPLFVTAFLPTPPSQIKTEDTTPSSPLKTEDITQSSDSNSPRHDNNSHSLKDMLRTVGSNDVEVFDVTSTIELQNDARKMFLLSLLPDVNAMSDVQMRIFKREVLNIIGNILDSENVSQ